MEAKFQENNSTNGPTGPVLPPNADHLAQFQYLMELRAHHTNLILKEYQQTDQTLSSRITNLLDTRRELTSKWIQKSLERTNEIGDLMIGVMNSYYQQQLQSQQTTSNRKIEEMATEINRLRRSNEQMQMELSSGRTKTGQSDPHSTDSEYLSAGHILQVLAQAALQSAAEDDVQRNHINQLNGGNEVNAVNGTLGQMASNTHSNAVSNDNIETNLLHQLNQLNQLSALSSDSALHHNNQTKQQIGNHSDQHSQHRLDEMNQLQLNQALNEMPSFGGPAVPELGDISFAIESVIGKNEFKNPNSNPNSNLSSASMNGMKSMSMGTLPPMNSLKHIADGSMTNKSNKTNQFPVIHDITESDGQPLSVPDAEWNKNGDTMSDGDKSVTEKDRDDKHRKRRRRRTRRKSKSKKKKNYRYKYEELKTEKFVPSSGEDDITDKTWLFCNHPIGRNGTNSSKVCGVNWIRVLKDRPHQCQHHCNVDDQQPLITRSFDKTFTNCAYCDGTKPCIRYARMEEIVEFQEMMRKCGDLQNCGLTPIPNGRGGFTAKISGNSMSPRRSPRITAHRLHSSNNSDGNTSNQSMQRPIWSDQSLMSDVAMELDINLNGNHCGNGSRKRKRNEIYVNELSQLKCRYCEPNALYHSLYILGDFAYFSYFLCFAICSMTLFRCCIYTF